MKILDLSRPNKKNGPRYFYFLPYIAWVSEEDIDILYIGWLFYVIVIKL